MGLSDEIKNIQDFFTETWREVERLRQVGATTEEIALHKIGRAKMIIVPISHVHNARKDPLSHSDTHCDLMTLSLREGELDYTLPNDKKVQEEHLTDSYREFMAYLREANLNPKLKTEQHGQIVKVTISSSAGLNYNEAG